jgi:hypothetical protein
MNAMKNRFHCNCGLAVMLSEVVVKFISLFSPFDPRKGPFIDEKSVKSPEISPRSSGVAAFRYEKSEE